MHHPLGSIPYEERRRVEAAVLALVLAEDWPWRADELAQRLSLPADVIGLATAMLRADGLLISEGDRLRASWTAVRCDELGRYRPVVGPDSNERRGYVQGCGAAIPLYQQGERPATAPAEAQQTRAGRGVVARSVGPCLKTHA